MRTVKITDLKKLAETAGSDEVLTVSGGDLFAAPLSTVLTDYATKVSLGAVSTSLGNLQVSLGNFKAEASDLFATKVSLGTVTTDYATKVSLGNVQAQVSLCATKVSLGNVQAQVSLCATTVSLGNVGSRVTALEQLPQPTVAVVSLGNVPSSASDGDLAVVINGSNEKGSALAFYHNSAWYRASDNVPLASLPSSSCVQDPSYTFPSTTNNNHPNNHTFATADRPLIVALQTNSGLTQGVQYAIHTVNVNSGNTEIFTMDGVKVGWITGRGTRWEVLAC